MRGTVGMLAGIVLLAACGSDGTTTPVAPDQLAASAAKSSAGQAGAETDATVNQELAALRRVTARFHDIDAAATAGWSAQITGCMASDSGGMGFHYGNVGLIDGSVSVEQPELLLYEPQKNGSMQLVAVEYIIPYVAHARDAAAPVLFGHEFTRNDTFQLWGLHAWVWAENPSGMFANWNPKVSCAYAAGGAMVMTH
jgi:hypothetical protein